MGTVARSTCERFPVSLAAPYFQADEFADAAAGEGGKDRAVPCGVKNLGNPFRPPCVLDKLIGMDKGHYL